MALTLGEYMGAGSGTTKLLLHLNGSSTDSSGNSNNGIIVGASSVDAKFGKGYYFANPSSTAAAINYIYVPNSSSMNPGSSDLTLGIWFKTSATGRSQAIIFKYNSLNHKNLLGFEIDASYYFKGIIRDGNNNNISTTSPNTVNDGKWHSAIQTRVGTTGSLYLDGNLVDTNTNSSIGTINLNSSGSYWWIGCYSTSTLPSTGSNNSYNGYLDEHFLEIGKGWTASEVKKYYTYAKGRFNN